MHTEAEAKELWCPMAREVASRRESPRPARCMASRCTVWRWASKPNPEWRAPPQHPQDWGSMRDTRFDPPLYVEDRERGGYCGLSSLPVSAGPSTVSDPK